MYKKHTGMKYEQIAKINPMLFWIAKKVLVLFLLA